MREPAHSLSNEEIARVFEDISRLLQVKGDKNETSCDLYTCAYLEDRTYYIHQEIYGEVIPGSEGEYPMEKSPFMALRMHIVDGQDYGRSLVEEYYGDLMSMEALQKALVEGSAAAARCLFLVSPNGTTRARTIRTAGCRPRSVWLDSAARAAKAILATPPPTAEQTRRSAARSAVRTATRAICAPKPPIAPSR